MIRNSSLTIITTFNNRYHYLPGLFLCVWKMIMMLVIHVNVAIIHIQSRFEAQSIRK